MNETGLTTMFSVMVAVAMTSGCALYFETDESAEEQQPDVAPPPLNPTTPPPSPPPIALPRCDPAPSSTCECDDGTPSVSILDANGDRACWCGDAFTRAADGVLGRWQGPQTLPEGWWDDGASRVEFTFYDDGSYETNCPGDCSSLYYGSDEGHPGRGYEITDILANGEAVGRIDVYFGDTSGSLLQGAIEALRFDASGGNLRFEFWRTWGGRYGPVRFDLQRCAPLAP